MLISMRTTLILDDALLREARRRAAERGTTLSQVVNDALRAAFRTEPRRRAPLKLVTYGDPTNSVHHEPDAFKMALELEDSERQDRPLAGTTPSSG